MVSLLAKRGIFKWEGKTGRTMATKLVLIAGLLSLEQSFFPHLPAPRCLYTNDMVLFAPSRPFWQFLFPFHVVRNGRIGNIVASRRDSRGKKRNSRAHKASWGCLRALQCWRCTLFLPVYINIILYVRMLPYTTLAMHLMLWRVYVQVLWFPWKRGKCWRK